MRATTFALIALALTVRTEPGLADSRDYTPKEEMQAAAVLLSIATLSDGKIEVLSNDTARFADGSVTFRREDACKIGLYSKNRQGQDLSEVWDFRHFTGAYTTTRTLGTYRVNLLGDSPQTRCFQIPSSSKGCSSTAFLPSGNPGDFAKEYEMIGKIKSSCTSRNVQ